jgi:hypothetical protein
MSARDPLIVSRFDMAIEPAIEEESILTIGAIAEDGTPVALMLDPENRAKVGGWLVPDATRRKEASEPDATHHALRMPNGDVWPLSEFTAQGQAAAEKQGGVLVQRTIRYGPWTDVT